MLGWSQIPRREVDDGRQEVKMIRKRWMGDNHSMVGKEEPASVLQKRAYEMGVVAEYNIVTLGSHPTSRFGPPNGRVSSSWSDIWCGTSRICPLKRLCR